MANNEDEKRVCSFCGRDERDVNFLISGYSGYICDECATRANEYV